MRILVAGATGAIGRRLLPQLAAAGHAVTAITRDAERRAIVIPMSTLGRARRPASYEDLLALPDHVVGEIVDGELNVSPRPSARHAMASSVLGGELAPPFHGRRGGPGGWWILDEPELHLGPDVLVPDMAGWRRERMPAVPDIAYFALAPDWICEVLSPHTGRLDRLKKLPVYAREGVHHAWLVDPIQKTLEVMRLESGRWTIIAVHGDDEVVRAEPFDAIELSLALLWVVESSEA